MAAATLMADLVGVGEAARTLGVSSERVRQLCNGGALAFVDSPYGRLVERVALERLVRERRARRTPLGPA